MNPIKMLFLTLTISLFSNLSFAETSLSQIYKQLGLSEDITYSADMDLQMSKDSGIPEIGPTKVYFKKGTMRTEMNAPNGIKMVVILQKDGILYSYNDIIKSWIKVNVNEAMQKQAIPQYAKIGEEVVDGLSCTKYEMKDLVNNVQGTVWVFDAMIYKNSIVTGGKTMTVVFKNIQKQDLEDSLFMPPADAKIQDMSAMMNAQAPAPA
jgi:outer membrane lipoprotein-sorting protein